MLNTSSTSVREIWHDAVAPLDPYLPLGDILTLDETQRRGHGAATLYLNVFFGLGAATLLIVLVGLHGVHAFLMAERVRDVGVRRALGAPAARILRESVLRGLRPVGIGLVLGCVPGVLAWRSFLPDEPSVLALALPPLLLLTLSVWAVWGPTRRATELHPMDVLREE